MIFLGNGIAIGESEVPHSKLQGFLVTPANSKSIDLGTNSKFPFFPSERSMATPIEQFMR
jgi:hypothetical protein